SSRNCAKRNIRDPGSRAASVETVDTGSRAGALARRDRSRAMTTRTIHAIVAGTVFDGSRLHNDCAVIVDRTAIAALMPRGQLPTIPMYTLPEGLWLAPGFIDCQVNGGGDALFNDAPTPDTIDRIAAAHLRLGTTSLLPTLITDTRASMQLA